MAAQELIAIGMTGSSGRGKSFPDERPAQDWEDMQLRHARRQLKRIFRELKRAGAAGDAADPMSAASCRPRRRARSRTCRQEPASWFFQELLASLLMASAKYRRARPRRTGIISAGPDRRIVQLPAHLTASAIPPGARGSRRYRHRHAAIQELTQARPHGCRTTQAQSLPADEPGHRVPGNTGLASCCLPLGRHYRRYRTRAGHTPGRVMLPRRQPPSPARAGSPAGLSATSLTICQTLLQASNMPCSRRRRSHQ
jgi:hypothetical protein